MAIINTIREGGIPLTTLMPLLLNLWCTGDKWTTAPSNIAKYLPTLRIVDYTTKTAYLNCKYPPDDDDGTYTNGFIPLIDFSIDIYTTTIPYLMGRPSNVSLLTSIIFKKYKAYQIVLPSIAYGHSHPHYSTKILYYNGTNWVDLWTFNVNDVDTMEPFRAIVYETYPETGTTPRVSYTFKAHILSPLVPLQPNYNL